MSTEMVTARSFAIEAQGKVHFGAGTVTQLSDFILHHVPESGAGPRRAFVVTDRGVLAAGVSAQVEDILQAAGIAVARFADVDPNPSTTHLEAGGSAIREYGPSVVVAVGGGAVLDVAKGLALMAVNPGSACDFDYHREPPNPGLPLIALPTTAGTGSETNPWGVIDDPEAERKFYVGHASVLPRLVILDPELTVSLPARATAAAGMDALAHALESLSSRRRNVYADMLNREVVRSVMHFLPAAVANGADLEARGQLLLAAHLAGMAFATTGLGLGHAIAHALSARAGVAHGVALAVMMPHVLAFNLPVCAQTYAGVGEWIGQSRADARVYAGEPHRASAPDEHVGRDADGASAGALIEAVSGLALAVGIPGSLGDLGVREELLPSIAADALVDEVLVNAPRIPTAEEVVVLLMGAL